MAVDFDAGGNLPPGIHGFTWTEVVDMFGWNEHRRRLLQGLDRAIRDLILAGCQTLYVDGSFVTQKGVPGDFDACWDRAGVDVSLLRNTPLLSFQNRRAAQKAAYGGELFPTDLVADGVGTRFLDFFQVDKDTGGPKGIVMLDLRIWP